MNVIEYDLELLSFFEIPLGETVNADGSAFEKGADQLIAATSSDYKYLNLVPASIANDGSESYYAAENLSLADLAGNDELQGYTYNTGYVLATPGGDSDAARLSENLLATPTKSTSANSSGSKSALICSQVLITPEHNLSRNNARQSEMQENSLGKIKPRALKL